MKKQVIILAVIIVLVGFAVYQNASVGKSGINQTGNSNLEELPRVGFKAPAFTLKSLDGQTHSTKQLAGKPIIINFWASWCGPCRVEAPEFVKLYAKYKNDLEIYAVNLTLQDNINDVKSFVETFGFTFPILMDDDRKNQISDRFQVQAIPTTFFVDKNGMIVDKITGATDPKSLEKKFKNLISR
jgi:cytochrome c biogenesis protein CcmG/thiol:disulfide interchange protein DsbE